MKRLLAALLFLAPSTAWATCSSVPYTFTPNTLIQSGQVNANFAAVVNCANTIDASQITTGVLPVARGGTNNPTWTTGSVVFATAPTQLGQDNANLFWDSTNHRLGILTNTPAATLDVNGPVVSRGGSAGLEVFDRSASGQAQFFRDSGTNRLWDSTFGDTIDYDSAGHVSIDTTPNASFQLTVNGTVNAGQYNVAARILASTSGNYNVLYDGSGNGAVVMGYSGDQTTYYDNNVHTFRNSAASTTYAILNSSSLTLNGLYSSQGSGAGYEFNDRTVPANNYFWYGQANFARLSLNGSTELMKVDNGGGVYASGTLNCGIALGGQCIHSTVSGDSINNYTNTVWAFYASGGAFGQTIAGQINSSAPGTAGTTTACLVSGYYIAGTSGLTVCGSDERLKNVGDVLSDGLSLVDQLKPVNFTWKKDVEKHPQADDGLHGGFVAQDVLKIMPQCVNKNPDDFYSLDSNCLIAYLAKAIQELDAKVSSK